VRLLTVADYLLKETTLCIGYTVQAVFIILLSVDYRFLQSTSSTGVHPTKIHISSPAVM